MDAKTLTKPAPFDNSETQNLVEQIKAQNP
jgi:hypothetical protein